MDTASQIFSKQYLILVDENDRQWGKLEKLEVHQLGLLHRAFSVFIFNTRGDLLIQQRNEKKYHSGGLWSNACCSHPLWGEEVKDAVNRRLLEELGLKIKTEFLFSIIYNIKLDHGLIEHEFDHVYLGITDTIPTPDPAEITDLKFVNINDLEDNMKAKPHLYTEWLKIIFDQLVQNEKVKSIVQRNPI